ncbi:hypothetical protein [Nocardia carnea]|uniref:hypothetical protein n=1 Tax=Nocardia carnea TaxID=37328 RepID=UPI002456F51C|nr:hypothetical protein [Nocardia carnea]
MAYRFAYRVGDRMVRIGQLYRVADTATTTRTLRVDKLDVQRGRDRRWYCRADCTVIRQRSGDHVTEPMEPVSISAARLAGSTYLLLSEY